LRGACNAIACIEKSQLREGVYTASAGNFAQGLAYCTQKFGVPCDVFMPDHAPSAKVNSVQGLGGKIHKVTFDDWWEIMKAHRCDGMGGKFIHPVSDHTVIAGIIL
jgi:threonine dehydratase